MTQLVFLKLGGSLITDKNSPHTANLEVIRFFAEEIKSALKTNPDLHLLLGHGSGSFGHVPASKYHTREGVHSAEEWRGFVEVWSEASALNRIVVEQFKEAGLQVISLPPSASMTSVNGAVNQWNTEPITHALDHDLLPLIFGDVIFDRALGGTIFSTEQLFSHLAQILQPARILIAGIEPGVWMDFPACTQLVREITPSTYPGLSEKLFPSLAVDVTGGMAGKIKSMVELVKQLPHLQVSIFNPMTPGTLREALQGGPVGTVIHS